MQNQKIPKEIFDKGGSRGKNQKFAYQIFEFLNSEKGIKKESKIGNGNIMVKIHQHFPTGGGRVSKKIKKVTRTLEKFPSYTFWLITMASQYGQPDFPQNLKMNEKISKFEHFQGEIENQF